MSVRRRRRGCRPFFFYLGQKTFDRCDTKLFSTVWLVLAKIKMLFPLCDPLTWRKAKDLCLFWHIYIYIHTCILPLMQRHQASLCWDSACKVVQFHTRPAVGLQDKIAVASLLSSFLTHSYSLHFNLIYSAYLCSSSPFVASSHWDTIIIVSCVQTRNIFFSLSLIHFFPVTSQITSLFRLCVQWKAQRRIHTADVRCRS